MVVYSMQGISFSQKQQLRAIPVQIQANAILNMNLIELQQFIETEAIENPALEVKEDSRCPVCGFLAGGSSCPVCGTSASAEKSLDSEKFSERDYLEKAFSAAGQDEAFDPFRTVASGMDLCDYLKQQARMCFGGRKLRIAEFLIDSLDDDGFFRESLYETAEEFATAVPEIEAVLDTIQSFDPAGIAAKDLRECLLLQIRALNDNSTTANFAHRIICDQWDNFSRMKLKVIAKEIGTTQDVVLEACEYIKDNLTPHPASAYRAPYDELAPRETAAIVPDVVINDCGTGFVAEVVDRYSALLGIDGTYDSIYKSLKSGDSYLSDDDSKHVKEHVERVKCILDAIKLRKKTLARVATYLAEYQKDFLKHGASELKPLRQKDLAKELGVHESTICRALAGKSCRLPSGEVISFEVFFDSALPIRNMIRQIISISKEPLSDGEITKKLADAGIVIARRTVAKYRDQIRVLPYQLRAA